MTPNVDTIAGVLTGLGRIARSMPPAWDGAKITQLASGPDGQVFGRMLPGRGLYLARDLKTLGITKPLPHVYERTTLARVVEGLDVYGQLRVAAGRTAERPRCMGEPARCQRIGSHPA